MNVRSARIPMASVMKMAQTPALLRQSLRTFTRKRLTAPLDYYFRDGYSAPFVQVDMKITNACNLRCKMCPQWGEAGWHHDQPAAFLRDVVRLDTYRQMVDEIAAFRPWMCIWGGEPFVYPDLMPLVRHMKQRGLTVSIVTNGTTLTSHAPELVDVGLDVLMVSIDGPRDAHDTIRGAPGIFDRALAGVTALQEAKKRADRNTPYLFIFATVSKDNVGTLDQVFEIGADTACDGVVVYYGWYQTEESCRGFSALMKERLDTTAASPWGGIWNYGEIDVEALTATVSRIMARRWPFPVLFAPALKLGEISRYYNDHAYTFGHRKCVAPWAMVEILPNGDVALCRDYPDYVVGNIKEESLLKIWNADRIRRFRGVLKEEGLFSVCSRCCQLMGW